MILTTVEGVPGRELVETIGLVRGSVVRSADLRQDLLAKMKQVIGGEVQEYSKLIAEVREQALDRMIAEAVAQEADAIVGIRYASTEIAEGAAEILVYGTAVKLKPEGS